MIHHLPLTLRLPYSEQSDDMMDVDTVVDEKPEKENVILVSDRDGRLTGLFWPPHLTQGYAMPTLFEAQLPRSLVRIRQGTVRPPWRRPPDEEPGMKNVLADDLLGATVDGQIYQFSIVDGRAYKVLKMLEGLAKLRDIIQMDAAGRYIPEDNFEEATMMTDERNGIDDKAKYHIDGDLLARYVSDQHTMVELLRLMQHTLYRGPNEHMFLDSGKDLLGLPTESSSEEVLRQLHLWYSRVMMPML